MPGRDESRPYALAFFAFWREKNSVREKTNLKVLLRHFYGLRAKHLALAGAKHQPTDSAE